MASGPEAPKKPAFISPRVERFLMRLLYGNKKERIENLEYEINALEHASKHYPERLARKRQQLAELRNSPD